MKDFLRGVSLIIIPIAVLIVYSEEAKATIKVYEPYVEAGEAEIEVQGSYDYDQRVSKDKKQKEKLAIGYGVNKWWFTEISGEIEKARSDEQFKFTALEFENRFQLTERGKYFADLGFFAEFEGAFEDRHPSEFKFGPLLSKQTGRFVHTTNWILKKEVGGGAMEEWEGQSAWSSKYLMNKHFEPGFEYHAGFNRLRSNHNTFNDQQHQVGPVFYGKIGAFKYDIGYLFGVSRDAQDGMLKWVLEYEI